MTIVQYFCFFDTWNGFMDGQLLVSEDASGERDTLQDYDFVDLSNKDSDEENLLIPFTEDEARKHFALKGYPNVTFIYGQDKLDTDDNYHEILNLEENN